MAPEEGRDSPRERRDARGELIDRVSYPMLGMLVDSLIARFHVCLFLLAMTIGQSPSTAPSSSYTCALRRRSLHHTAYVALCTPSSAVYWETGSVQKKGEGYMTCMRQVGVAMAVVVCM